jgi:hypothetical protein
MESGHGAVGIVEYARTVSAVCRNASAYCSHEGGMAEAFSVTPLVSPGFPTIRR